MIKDFTNRTWIFIVVIWEYQHYYSFKIFRRFWWLAPLHNQLARLPVFGRCEQHTIDSIGYNYVIAKYSHRCEHWLPFLIRKNNFFRLNYCILHVLFKIYIKAHRAGYHFSMENTITLTVIKQLYLLLSFFHFVTQFHRVKTFTTRKC